MSDYIVYKIIDCPNYCNEGVEYTETEARRCIYCINGKTKIEVDLQEALIELIRTNGSRLTDALRMYK